MKMKLVANEFKILFSPLLFLFFMRNFLQLISITYHNTTAMSIKNVKDFQMT